MIGMDRQSFPGSRWFDCREKNRELVREGVALPFFYPCFRQ